MNPSSMFDYLQAIAAVAGIISMVVAVFQTIKVQSLTLEKERKVWTQIASIKAMLRHLQRQDVQQAYGLANEQFRDLLREASLLEKKYTVKTIKLWRKVGKLSSDWQERQAMMLLSSSEIEKFLPIQEKDIKVSEDFATFDETPPDHPVAKLRPTLEPSKQDEETNEE